MKRLTVALLLAAATCIPGCKGIRSGGAFPWQTKSAKKPPGRHPLKQADEKAKQNDEDKDPAWDFGFKKEKELDEPVKMFITWTESEYTQAGKPPIRGFTARAYFYNKEYEPIEVDGQLIVYGFDDTSRADAKRTADKKFVFPSDHLANQFSTSHLGPSYSLWVPWDEVGGEQKHITLLPVFRSGRGQIVRGEQIVNILHGKKPAAGQERRVVADRSSGSGGKGGVRQVAFIDPLAASRAAGSVESANSKAESSLKTTTIQVPPSTMRYLQAPIATRQPLVPRRVSEPVRSPVSSVEQRREKSAHYIFDSSRAPIRPRDTRRYASSQEAAEWADRGTSPQHGAGHQIENQKSKIENLKASATVPQPSIRSEPRIPQAPARPHARPTSGPAQWPRYRAGSQSAPPTTPQALPRPPLGGFSSAGQPIAN